MPNGQGQNVNNTSSSSNATGAYTVDGTEQTLSETYTTSNSDESVILVKNGGSANLNGVTITKSGGDSSNTENSEFYGVNAGILVTEGSKSAISDSTISTKRKGKQCSIFNRDRL